MKKKTIYQLNYSDLVDICEARGIEVKEGEDVFALRKKLKPAPKPKE